ncbi:MAG: carbohydrate kinase family protein [Syntrophobacteraceae bacterium]
MTKRTFQVFGFGQCSLDHLGEVDAYPSPDTKCEFRELTVQGGGPVATALVALARWGVSCTFSGMVGNDRFGDMIRASLDKEGIDITGLLVRNGFDSQFAFIVAEPGMGRRTIFWRRPTGSPPRPDEVDLELLRRSRVFHTDGLFAETSLALCRAARKAEIPIVVDAGSLREGMLDIAQASDYFIASEAFSKALVGTDGSPHDTCRQLAELGPRVVGVTLGARGYIALAEGRIIERPAYQVQAVDTTGCGDVFHAGFIYGLLQEWGIDKSLDFAAWAAAGVSLKLGGRASIPALSDWTVASE